MSEHTPHSDHIQPCPVCDHEMRADKGSKESVCQACGYKESCCY